MQLLWKKWQKNVIYFFPERLTAFFYKPINYKHMENEILQK